MWKECFWSFGIFSIFSLRTNYQVRINFVWAILWVIILVAKMLQLWNSWGRMWMFRWEPNSVLVSDFFSSLFLFLSSRKFHAKNVRRFHFNVVFHVITFVRKTKTTVETLKNRHCEKQPSTLGGMFIKSKIHLIILLSFAVCFFFSITIGFIHT